MASRCTIYVITCSNDKDNEKNKDMKKDRYLRSGENHELKYALWLL